MGRPVVLSNGSMFVGLNEQGLVHDFYYPYVGLENLTTSRNMHHLIGVWVDGSFSWVDDGTWDILVDFESDALVSTVKMTNKTLKVALNFEDFVDHEFNAFCRKGTITNFGETERTIRIFLHQVFQISRSGRADTALFVPDDSYILDYKGRCSLLIYGQSAQGQPFDQYAIGEYNFEDKKGTYFDAEDGELSGNPVEHGGVDSVIRCNETLGPNQSGSVEYWVIASDSQYNAEKIHHRFLRESLQKRLVATRNFWHQWHDQSANTLHAVPSQYLDLTKKSAMIIKAHIDRRGGILASGDSSIYNYGKDYYSYVWPRDGAYVVWPLIRLGHHEEARHFFEFCRDILTNDGYLMHKYQPDRAIGSTWHPLVHNNRKELAIQEDETAIVVYMLGEYYHYTKDEDFVHKLYDTFIKPAAHFMADFIDTDTGLPHASYDLWEEKFLTSTYTTAIVYQSLLTAADFAEMFGHADDSLQWKNAAKSILEQSTKLQTPEGWLAKGYLLQDGELQYDNTLDISSLYGAMMFGLHTDSIEPILKTVQRVEEILLDTTPVGGTPRYDYDHYFESDPPFLGNPWFVTTLWMAQYYMRAKQPEKTQKYLDWTMQHTLPSGVLSEQLNPTSGEPKSVAPLVWSHAEFINTVLDFANYHNNQ